MERFFCPRCGAEMHHINTYHRKAPVRNNTHVLVCLSCPTSMTTTENPKKRQRV